MYDDTFFDGKSNPGPFKLGCTNYTLDGKADAILSLLAKVNSDMFKRTVAGTVYALPSYAQANLAGAAYTFSLYLCPLFLSHTEFYSPIATPSPTYRIFKNIAKDQGTKDLFVYIL